MGLRMKNVNIVGIHWNIQFLGGNCLNGGFWQFADLKGGWQKREGVDTSVHTMSILHVAAVTWPSLQARLKSDENGHALQPASDTIFCWRVLTFFENVNYFLFH